MIAIPSHPQHSNNYDRTPADLTPCVVCGKGVREPWKHAVRMADGGASLVTEAEAAALDQAEDMGWFPIGADCLRRHPELRPYVK